MREEIKLSCELFLENRNIVKSAAKWESAYMYPLCASIYTQRKRRADPERLKACREILRERAGLFSNFRGTAQLPMVTLLAVSEEPGRMMELALQVYQLLKQEFFSSAHLPVAAMMIAQLALPEQFDTIASRTKRLYHAMKTEHPFLTSSEDSAFAALLALSCRSDASLLQEMERSYELLTKEFFSANAVQSLTHVLTLGEGSADTKCRRTMELFQMLKDKGCRFGTGYELPVLGVLGILDVELGTLAEEIAQVNDYLSGQKGFGAFGIGAKQRLLYAGLLVAFGYTSGEDISINALETTAVSSTVALIVAQEAAICAAIAASSAAAAASSSAGNN